MNEKDNFFERVIEYEAKMMRLFKELGLKANQCQLIRAFIILSKGESEFEASFSEMDNLMQKAKNGNKKRTSRYALNTLLDWQNENGFELIRVLRKGRRFTTEEGTFDYSKSKYRFVVLKELVRILYSNAVNFDSEFDALMQTVKSEFKPVEKVKKHYPLHNLRKARKTVETKIKRIFELSKEAGLKPFDECMRLLSKCLNISEEMESEFQEKENRDKFIKNFEELLEDESTQEKQEETIK